MPQLACFLHINYICPVLLTLNAKSLRKKTVLESKVKGKNMKILIIDDEECCARGMAFAIEPSGHQCQIFTSAVEAIERYSQIKPDLVITDAKMSDMDGLVLVRRIRSMDRMVKILLNTGFDDRDMINKAFEAGIDTFFLKPVEIREVMQMVDRIQIEMEARDIAGKSLATGKRSGKYACN